MSMLKDTCSVVFLYWVLATKPGQSSNSAQMGILLKDFGTAVGETMEQLQ